MSEQTHHESDEAVIRKLADENSALRERVAALEERRDAYHASYRAAMERVAELEADRYRLLKELDELAPLSIYVDDGDDYDLTVEQGCFTGDCPHESAGECLEAVRAWARERDVAWLAKWRLQVDQTGNALARVAELEGVVEPFVEFARQTSSRKLAVGCAVVIARSGDAELTVADCEAALAASKRAGGEGEEDHPDDDVTQKEADAIRGDL